jgi:hypothetical protein
MTRANLHQRVIAFHLVKDKLALTLLVENTETAWHAQLLDHRFPNEANPICLVSQWVSFPDEGQAILEQRLAELLTAKGLPQSPVTWIESGYGDT